MSLSEQKTRRKCLCSKHAIGGVSASSHLFPLCQWKTWLKPVWHVPASICPICHSHNHWITRPQPKWGHVLSFLNIFWAATEIIILVQSACFRILWYLVSWFNLKFLSVVVSIFPRANLNLLSKASYYIKLKLINAQCWKGLNWYNFADNKSEIQRNQTTSLNSTTIILVSCNPCVLAHNPVFFHLCLPVSHSSSTLVSFLNLVESQDLRV